jgi:hypothetical protein
LFVNSALRFSPDGNGNFAGKKALVFLVKRAPRRSSFLPMKTKRFDKKLQWTAGNSFSKFGRLLFFEF